METDRGTSEASSTDTPASTTGASISAASAAAAASIVSQSTGLVSRPWRTTPVTAPSSPDDTSM